MRRNLVDLTSTLRRHEAEAQAVLTGIVEGVYAVDKNRIIRYLNPQAAKLLGVQAGRGRRPVLRRRAEAAAARTAAGPASSTARSCRRALDGRAQSIERLQSARATGRAPP